MFEMIFEEENTRAMCPKRSDDNLIERLLDTLSLARNSAEDNLACTQDC